MSDDDRSSGVFAVALTFLILTWILVPLRVYVRTVMTKSFGMDDWLMVVTQVFFTAYLIGQLGGWKNGTGKHRSDLSPENNTTALHFWFVCEVTYVITATIVKLSVGVFLLRLCIIKWHTWLLRILMIASVILGTAYEFVVLFQCQPISTFWEEAPGTVGKCLENDPVVITTYIASIMNCFADWAFGILPMFIVWSLNMRKKTRIMVMGILGFASIGSTATIVRLFYVPDMLNGQDFLYATTNFAIWTTVELGVSIIAASIPTLRPALQFVLGKLGLSRTYQLSRGSPWTPSHGYVRTEEGVASYLRPGNGVTTTAATGPNAFPSLKYLGSQKGDIELAGITKTVEVSMSRDSV
ncbi:hypothetical protein M426DRAFT_14531 [Hypoxylon sp. CI-4A]|nr:hypothetical protein M426DRAFT_14531 [Hypoxylon sp. CI-4A]